MSKIINKTFQHCIQNILLYLFINR